MCENTEKCNEENCSKRHPKVCRHFSNNGSCRHGEKCAYKHYQNDGQIKLYEQVTLLLLKHEKDITSLKEEVNELKNIIQQMAQELVKNVQKGVETEGIELQGHISEKVLKCEKCDFTCDKKITLKKHTNTNHMDPKKQSVNTITVDKGKFCCDECPVSFKNLKNSKKHQEKEHNVKKDTTELKHYDKNLCSLAQAQESILNCTATCDCDKCVDEWVY